MVVRQPVWLIIRNEEKIMTLLETWRKMAYETEMNQQQANQNDQLAAIFGNKK